MNWIPIYKLTLLITRTFDKKDYKPLCYMSCPSTHFLIHLLLSHCHAFCDSSPIVPQVSWLIPNSPFGTSIFHSTENKGKYKIAIKS